jgi:chromosome segregation ATPase
MHVHLRVKIVKIAGPKTFIICKTSVIDMQQVKKSVTARIPIELYDKCNQQYENMTDAIIAGLDILCNQSKSDCKTDVIDISNLNIQLEEKTARIQDLQNHNDILKREFENFKNKETGSKETLHSYESRLEEKNFRIIDLQAHNETLKKELETLQNMHTNYMLQVQTLINQKAIESPGAKKPWWRFW